MCFIQSDQVPGSLKAELKTIYPELEEMQKRKAERRNQFFEVVEQIQKIRSETYESNKPADICNVIDDADLSLRKLEELHTELQALQNEKVLSFGFCLTYDAEVIGTKAFVSKFP